MRQVDSEKIIIKMNPREIVYLDNIIQGYDGLALVTTIDASAGEVLVHVTPGTKKEVLAILRHFPKPIEIKSE